MPSQSATHSCPHLWCVAHRRTFAPAPALHWCATAARRSASPAPPLLCEPLGLLPLPLQARAQGCGQRRAVPLADLIALGRPIPLQPQVHTLASQRPFAPIEHARPIALRGEECPCTGAYPHRLRWAPARHSTPALPQPHDAGASALAWAPPSDPFSPGGSGDAPQCWLSRPRECVTPWLTKVPRSQNPSRPGGVATHHPGLLGPAKAARGPAPLLQDCLAITGRDLPLSGPLRCPRVVQPSSCDDPQAR